MQEIYCPLRLTGVAAALTEALGAEAPQSAAPALEAIRTLCAGFVDRVLMYNPDAVALWLFEKYTDLFLPVMRRTQLTLPLQTVMPSVTPVCFGTMYTGALPEVHGIQSYTKPVIRTEERRPGTAVFRAASLGDVSHLYAAGVEPSFAARFCDTLSRSTAFTAAVTDRDSVIAAAGSGRRELLGKRISEPLQQIMERRSSYVRDRQGTPLPACEDGPACAVAVAVPILCQGDVLGLVLFLSADGKLPGETEQKLAQTAAAFLGRQMED